MKKSGLIMLMMLLLMGCSHDTASVDIIGGADGPTAIFIASETSNHLLPLIIGGIIVVLLISIAIFLIKRKKK